MNKGKEFEQDFKKSLGSCGWDLWIYRPSDFGGGQASRFTNHSLCDYIVFSKDSGRLFFLELKSTQGTSFSCPSAKDHNRLVAEQKLIDDIESKEEKKEAVRALKELRKQLNTHDIKYHQIEDLLEIEHNDTCNNMVPYFVLNFRKYDRTFLIKPTDLCLALIETKKSSINLADAEKYGKELQQERIRKTQHFAYNAGEFIKPWS